MRRARTGLTAALLGALAVAGCAHGGYGAAGSRSAQRFAAEAGAVKAIAYEEEYVDARLVYQALPLGTPARAALRRKMLQYLVGPLAATDAERVRKDPSFFGSNDDLELAFESFKDALDLLAPAELWGTNGPGLAADERALLGSAARTVVAVFSPRGNEPAVATALFVLATLEPGDRQWNDRIEQLLGWLDTGAQLGSATSSGRGGNTASVGDVLDTVAGAWPSRDVVGRMTRLALERQDRLSSALRRPLGTGSARSAISELLLDSEAMQGLAVNLALLYLRCGQIAGAAEAVSHLAGKPGDDPELRQQLTQTAHGHSADDYLTLARRFLPRDKLFGGTSSDRLDAVAAAEVLRLGIERNPADVELLVLASRVARFLPAPFLAIRYLEDAQAVLERKRTSSEQLAEVSTDLLELSFARLRFLMEDPTQIEPAARQAEALRQRFADSRKRFGDGRLKISEADIDFALGRGYVDAGLIDRAEPLLERAHREDHASVEVTLQIGKLVAKRGDPARAAQILREALDNQERQAPSEETIGYVEGRSKLARALGDAYEVSGDLDQARAAWQKALRGWERLMVEHLRRKNLDASAEATVEVGRLQYQLGRHADGVQKFNEAIEQNESRGQTYIDALAFLIPQGDAEPALEIYRRVLARPSRSVNEYFKVYASMWIYDLTRRSTRTPDAVAEGYLRSLEIRKAHLRPRRDAAWYIPLARYVVGRLGYEQLVPLASTPGRRAELYFYEAMHRLAEGKSDDAHQLWNKVLETRMFSFFEFDMASRYLRSGAPSHPRPESAQDRETI